VLPAAQLLETNPGLFVFALINALALFIQLLFTVFLSKCPMAMSIDTPKEESMIDLDPVTTLLGMMNHNGMETIRKMGFYSFLLNNLILLKHLRSLIYTMDS